jgi:O-antigen ligase
VTLALVGVLGVGWVEVVSPFLTTASQSSNDLVRNSVGRGIRSAEARQSLFSSQLQIFEKGDLLGIGPAVTKSTLGAEGATAVHEAHNDYLGTLVERGPLGLTAVLALVGVTVVRLARFTTRPLPPRLAAVLPMPAALGGACLVFAATALTHEILHYRWLWTLLAVVAAVYLLAGETPPGAGGRPRLPDDLVRRLPWPRPPVPRAG